MPQNDGEVYGRHTVNDSTPAADLGVNKTENSFGVAFASMFASTAQGKGCCHGKFISLKGSRVIV